MAKFRRVASQAQLTEYLAFEEQLPNHAEFPMETFKLEVQG